MRGDQRSSGATEGNEGYSTTLGGALGHSTLTFETIQRQSRGQPEAF